MRCTRSEEKPCINTHTHSYVLHTCVCPHIHTGLITAAFLDTNTDQFINTSYELIRRQCACVCVVTSHLTRGRSDGPDHVIITIIIAYGFTHVQTFYMKYFYFCGFNSSSYNFSSNFFWILFCMFFLSSTSTSNNCDNPSSGAQSAFYVKSGQYLFPTNTS